MFTFALYRPMYIDCCTEAYGDPKCKACDGVGQHVFSLYVLPQRSVLLQNKSSLTQIHDEVSFCEDSFYLKQM